MGNKGTASGYVAPDKHKAIRWTLIVPKVIREYMRMGVRYYITDDGKRWQADIFDTKLLPNKKTWAVEQRISKTDSIGQG